MSGGADGAKSGNRVYILRLSSGRRRAKRAHCRELADEIANFFEQLAVSHDSVYRHDAMTDDRRANPADDLSTAQPRSPSASKKRYNTSAKPRAPSSPRAAHIAIPCGTRLSSRNNNNNLLTLDRYCRTRDALRHQRPAHADGVSSSAPPTAVHRRVRASTTPCELQRRTVPAVREVSQLFAAPATCS